MRKPPRRGEDRQPHQAADQCTVDANVLQVLADVQLRLFDDAAGFCDNALYFGASSLA